MKNLPFSYLQDVSNGHSLSRFEEREGKKSLNQGNKEDTISSIRLQLSARLFFCPSVGGGKRERGDGPAITSQLAVPLIQARIVDSCYRSVFDSKYCERGGRKNDSPSRRGCDLRVRHRGVQNKTKGKRKKERGKGKWSGAHVIVSITASELPSQKKEVGKGPFSGSVL